MSQLQNMHWLLPKGSQCLPNTCIGKSCAPAWAALSTNISPMCKPFYAFWEDKRGHAICLAGAHTDCPPRLTGPVKPFAELHMMLVVTMHGLSIMFTVSPVLSAGLKNRLLLLSLSLGTWENLCQSNKRSLDDYVYCCR